MRHTAVLVSCLCAIFLASSAKAGIADSIAFQGRLTDASDNPVPDGPRDLILSLWTDSVGGTMLHSEVVVVTVSKGLYTTCIGCLSSSFFDIFDGLDVYLEVQLAGSPPMSPRTVMRKVPYSISSSSLHSESESGAARARGIIATKPGGGTPKGFVILDADIDGDGHPDFVITDSAATDGASRRMGHDLDDDGTQDVVIADATSPSGASHKLMWDSDADGIADSWQDEDCDGISSRSVFGGRSGSTTGTIRMMATPDSASSVLEYDDNSVAQLKARLKGIVRDAGALTSVWAKGTGAMESECITAAYPDSAVSFLESDSDGDEIPESEYRIVNDGGGKRADVLIRGRSGSTTGTIRMQASPDSAASVLDHDSDGDGIPEVMVESKVGLGVAGGAVPGASILASALNSSGARIAGSNIGINEVLPYTRLFTDTNGDGVPESEFEQTCTPDSLLQISRIGGSGGGAGGSSYTMRTRIHELENILKNIGLLGTSKVSGRCDNDSAVTTASFTSATGSSTVWEKVDNTEAQCGASRDLNQDGLQDVAVSLSAVATRSVLKAFFQSGDVPTQSQFSNLLDATGGRSLLSSGMSGSTTATIRMQATPDSTVFDLGYSGSTTGSIRLQASSTGSANPIEHSSGAHLTVGGVWTNASDANLKENFQPIDGEELLEKISDLPISQWNYKAESEAVTHIGPTAQDFKEAFGVGANDKTISTIDPSGIALAAIKELNNKLNTQIQTLSQENKQLRKEMDDLKKLVQKLATDK